MATRQVQIDRRFLQVAMSSQHVNSAYVGFGFQQMSGETVAQGVGMNLFVLQSGTLRGLSARMPKNFGRDRMTGGMRAPAGKQPVDGFAPEPAPVDAEGSEQLGAEHDIAILASLASPDMDKHPLTVDVAHL